MIIVPGQMAQSPYDEVAKHLLGRHNQLDHTPTGLKRFRNIKPRRRRSAIGPSFGSIKLTGGSDFGQAGIFSTTTSVRYPSNRSSISFRHIMNTKG